MMSNTAYCTAKISIIIQLIVLEQMELYDIDCRFQIALLNRLKLPPQSSGMLSTSTELVSELRAIVQDTFPTYNKSYLVYIPPILPGG